jgi:hypothetical protein
MGGLAKVQFNFAPQLGIRLIDEGELGQLTFWKAIIAELVAVSWFCMHWDCFIGPAAVAGPRTRSAAVAAAARAVLPLVTK